MAIVIIPTPLRKFADSKREVIVSANRISDVVQELSSNFPDLGKHITNTNGEIASFINIFVDSDDIRNLRNEETEVKESTVISIVPAIAGGIHVV